MSAVCQRPHQPSVAQMSVGKVFPSALFNALSGALPVAGPDIPPAPVNWKPPGAVKPFLNLCTRLKNEMDSVSGREVCEVRSREVVKANRERAPDGSTMQLR